jgi:hypothetical protein
MENAGLLILLGTRSWIVVQTAGDEEYRELPGAFGDVSYLSMNALAKDNPNRQQAKNSLERNRGYRVPLVYNSRAKK